MGVQGIQNGELRILYHHSSFPEWRSWENLRKSKTETLLFSWERRRKAD